MRALLVLIILPIIVLTACIDKVFKPSSENLQKTVIAYNDLLRWNEFNKAKLFTDVSIRKDFEAWAKAAKARSLKVADYRILSTDFEAEGNEKIIEVEFDYYTSPTYILKTSVDKQRWSLVYIKDEKKNRWRLISSLPEFK